MPYLTFDDDETNTPHILKGLDTAPPSAIIRLQRETEYKQLSQIRDAVQESDFLGALLAAYLTVAVAGRPVTWDFLMETPMSEWPWSTHATKDDERAGDASSEPVDPPQPPLPDSEADDGTAAEEWPPRGD
ncbi:MAG: hypothetical protein CMH34_09960 [Microbacterium sp.]|nr:hypothetical protein [Microbacterium sp.]